MNAITIAVIVMIATFIFFFFHGNRVLKKRRKLIEEIMENEHKEIREISYVAYHGGLAELSKPQKLTLALSDDELLLVTNKGEKASLPMRNWLKLEKFTTSRKHDVKQRSMVVWGPFNNIMFKDQIRHFIVINYRDDQDGSPDNHLLIEHGNPDERDKIFKEIEIALANFRRSNLFVKQDKGVGVEVPTKP